MAYYTLKKKHPTRGEVFNFGKMGLVFSSDSAVTLGDVTCVVTCDTKIFGDAT